MSTVKSRCKLCGKPPVENPELFYTEGYYEMSVKMGSRLETYLVCTKCNRCSLKDSDLGKVFNIPKKNKTEKIIEDLRLNSRIFR